jgi:hypothetical protein
VKVGDLVRHRHYQYLIGLIIQSRHDVISLTQRHRVKWLKEDGIVAKRGWNKPRMFNESVLELISEAKV